MPVAKADRRRTAGRAFTLVTLLVLTISILFAALTSRLFIRPPSDEPERVDAVVVLSGDHGERLAKALQLIDKGVAPTFVHVGIPDLAPTVTMCLERQPFEVICLRPSPDSTLAEARAVANLSEARRWRSVAVVTSSPHVTRARIIFRRCLHDEVHVISARPAFSTRHWVVSVADEWLKVIYTLAVNPRC